MDYNKRAALSRGTVIHLSIALFFCVCVVFPVGSMFTRITPESFDALIHSAQFEAAVRNSLKTSMVSTLISMTLALAAAWCLERTAIRLKGIFSLVFVIPMLIPSISHAFGLVVLFGANGLLTNLLGLDSSIYGFRGIVAGEIIYSFPVAFLMFTDILRYEDGLPYKAADILGIPRFHQVCVHYAALSAQNPDLRLFRGIHHDHHRLRHAAAYLFCALLSLCVLMPVAAFCMMAFETKYPVNAAFTLYHIEKTINRGAGEYFVNSLLYAVFTGFTGTAAAFVCSYLTARTHGKFVQGCTCFP